MPAGAPDAAPRGAASSEPDSLARILGLPRLRDLVMGSSFFYTPNPDTAAGPDWLGSWSAWGDTGVSHFRGVDGTMNIDGDLATATFGFDSQWERWLAGVAISYTDGDGAYTSPDADIGGRVASSLASLHPYARYAFTGRTSVWGALGYGLGDLSLTPSRTETAIETDLDHAMMAFGGRTALSVRSGQSARFELALRSDARLTRTASDTVQGLLGAEGATSRVRVLLEGSGSLALPTGGMLSPTLEAGLRYDGGDAETGAGLEIGAGLGYSSGRLSVQVAVRGLVAHEDTEYEDWGYSGSVAYTPRADGRGLKLRLGTSRGAAQSGVHGLWARETAAGLARFASPAADRRYTAEFGYGLQGRMPRTLWQPFLGLESSQLEAASLRTGFTHTAGEHAELGLALQHRPGADGETEYGLELAGRVRW